VSYFGRYKFPTLQSVISPLPLYYFTDFIFDSNRLALLDNKSPSTNECARLKILQPFIASLKLHLDDCNNPQSAMAHRTYNEAEVEEEEGERRARIPKRRRLRILLSLQDLSKLRRDSDNTVIIHVYQRAAFIPVEGITLLLSSPVIVWKI